MKTILTLALTSLFLNAWAASQSPVFTSLTSNGKDFFAGVKSQTKGMEQETYLLKVSADNMSSSKLPLPAELSQREVISLVPTDDNQLVVITQNTVGGGDSPQFHLFDPKSGDWKKVGQVDCVTFTKLEVQKNSISLNCLHTNKKGQEIEIKKEVKIKDTNLSEPSTVAQSSNKSSGRVKAEMVGDQYEWKELKLKSGPKERVIKP